VIRTTLMGALAKGVRKIGQLEEALFTINGAITRSTDTGAEFDLPELLRIKAQILSARNDREAATTCLRQSIAKARAQHALSFELRSAMTFARMLREEGESAKARQCVASVYGRFTEGFGTADLRSAHEMIREMDAPSG
jgi:hypothetical protein